MERAAHMPTAQEDQSAARASIALRVLEVAVETLPIPTTPPGQPRDVEERGLALLEASLRLSHLRRVSEHLKLVDRTHLNRHVSIDLDLTQVPPRQQRALQRPGDQTKLWLPIGIQTRTSAAPAVIKNADGETLSTMTLREVTAAFSAGLVLLFRMLLEANPHSSRRFDPKPDSVASSDDLFLLKSERIRSLWLIEASVSQIVREGPSSFRLAETLMVDDSGKLLATAASGTRVDAEKIRGYARLALKTLATSQRRSFDAFLELMTVAALEYPLVPLVDASHPVAHLTYDSPHIPANRDRRIISFSQIGSALAPMRSFDLKYLTTIPGRIISHHITIDVSEQVRVQRFVLVTTADLPLVTRLVNDIREVASRYDELSAAGEKLLENELQSIVARLVFIGRRRVAELQGFRAYMSASGTRPSAQRPLSSQTQPLLHLSRPITGLSQVRDAIADQTLEALAGLISDFQQGRLTRLVNILTAERLRCLGARIEKSQLGLTVITDSDPREYAAHSHWTGRQMVKERASTEPIDTWAYMSMADDPPSLTGSVFRMAGALVGVFYLVCSLIFRDPIWWTLGRQTLSPELENNDALVAVLLLVPGLLLSRLDIPSTNTVLGQMRLFPRLCAYASAAVMAIAAMIVAVANRISVPVCMVLLVGLILPFAAAAVSLLLTRLLSARLLPHRTLLPTWIRRALRIPAAPLLMPKFTTFEASR